VRINGLFRHGWLIAPAMVEQALCHAGLDPAPSGFRGEESGLRIESAMTA
jgi:hypothetical protein